MKLIWKGCSFALQVLAIIIASPVIAEIVNINLLHLNDIYEIATPKGENARGGLARVATLRQQLLRENPRTYTLLAGDLLSPSALGTAKIDGKPIAGQQMVAVMNTLGLDYATFGNHEFDLKKDQFYKRLEESQFRWFSGNVSDKKNQPFNGVSPYIVLEVKGEQGTVVRVGLIGLTIPINSPGYVNYIDPIQAAKNQIMELKGKVDILIAVTHLSIDQDIQLAKEVPEVKMILGGHEHENIQVWRGQNLTPIFKADANARTVYVHRLSYDTTTKQLKIDSELVPIDKKFDEDPSTANVVKEWVEKAFEAFKKDGFKPEDEITTTSEPLDGLESSIRNQPTNLTQLITKFMLTEVEKADLAIINSGSIRIDDVINPGQITQYDVLRMLPYKDNVVPVVMKGSLLETVLNQGNKNKGSGGYLQTANVSQDEQKKWMINGQILDKNHKYTVAINEFLMEGKEQNLDFLTCEHSDITCMDQKKDIRSVVIDQWKKWRERSHSTCREIAFLCQKSLFEATFPQNNLLGGDARRNSDLH
ncbi:MULTISPECIES: bifunctional metallophosphatase/5'-nucleotidase [unclassified Microcoleus]|uniref:bifunctional metallophosphatase/5'-nucleotidase n=1 Tax=unclassified Microcoleus TaxID=2642155 RepID=UPI002FD3F2E9